MMGWNNGSWGVGEWVAMSFMMVVLWGAVITAAVWLFRSNRTSPSRTAPNSAAALLDERFARGEIDEGEFTQRREALRGTTARSR